MNADKTNEVRGGRGMVGVPAGGFRTILVGPPWPAQGGGAALPHHEPGADHGGCRWPSWPHRMRACGCGRPTRCCPGPMRWPARGGFTVRSPLTWVEFRLGLSGPSQLRNATEHLLFCTRGRAPVGFRFQPTWFNAPVAEHWRKPAEQFAVIERVSPGPYLELFARRRPESRVDWAVWGNEVASDVRLPGYPVPRYSEPGSAPEAESRSGRTDNDVSGPASGTGGRPPGALGCRS